MGKGLTPETMGENMREDIKMIKKKDLGCIHGQMAENMRESGSTISNMGRESTI